jgi:hypothetical protein
LFLEYEGNLINGKKVFGITKDNTVSIWEIQSKDHPKIHIDLHSQNTLHINNDEL